MAEYLNRNFSKKSYKWPTGALKGAQHHILSGKCKSTPQWYITSHGLGWLLLEKPEISVGGDVEKRGPLYIVDGDINWCSHYGKQFPQKIKNRTTSWSSNPTYGYISKGNGISVLKRYLYSRVYCSNIHNSQEMAITQVSTDNW